VSRQRFGRVGRLLQVALALSALAAAPDDSLEYAVKATFLYKFIPFVDWPASAFESPASPVVICVMGNDPVARLVDRAVSGQRIGNRPVMVRHIESVSRESGCHEIYASSAMTERSRAFAAVRGSAVLTVTDGGSGGSNGGDSGIITFVVQDNRVRFDIDDRAAAQSGLTIRSQLLDLARTVRARN
jgi:hypothetical protein